MIRREDTELRHHLSRGLDAVLKVKVQTSEPHIMINGEGAFESKWSLTWFGSSVSHDSLTAHTSQMFLINPNFQNNPFKYKPLTLGDSIGIILGLNLNFYS